MMSFLIRAVALVLAAGSCIGVAPAPRGHLPAVRFCSVFQTMSAAVLERTREQRWNERERVDDAQALLQLRLHEPLSTTIRMMADSYRPQGSHDDDRRGVGEVRDAGETRYEAAVFDRAGAFVRVEPVANAAFVPIIRKAHATAAHVLLNDVLAADTLVPRLGCARLVEYGETGAIRDDLQAALLRVPMPDAAFLARFRSAYAAFAGAPETLASPLSRATIARLGESPAIERIYHDDDGVGTSFDIVRLSNGTVRTYLLTADDGSRLAFQDGELCVVGDRRCVRASDSP